MFVFSIFLSSLFFYFFSICFSIFLHFFNLFSIFSFFFQFFFNFFSIFFNFISFFFKCHIFFIRKISPLVTEATAQSKNHSTQEIVQKLIIQQGRDHAGQKRFLGEETIVCESPGGKIIIQQGRDHSLRASLSPTRSID